VPAEQGNHSRVLPRQCLSPQPDRMDYQLPRSYYSLMVSDICVVFLQTRGLHTSDMFSPLLGPRNRTKLARCNHLPYLSILNSLVSSTQFPTLSSRSVRTPWCRSCGSSGDSHCRIWRPWLPLSVMKLTMLLKELILPVTCW